jgi:hypothetical protein
MGLSANAHVEPRGELLQKARQAALSRAEDRVRELRCPEHGEGVRLALEGSAVSVSGCCETFRRYAATVICGN